MLHVSVIRSNFACILWPSVVDFTRTSHSDNSDKGIQTQITQVKKGGFMQQLLGSLGLVR